MIASWISRDYRAGRDIPYHAALSGNTSLLTYREVVRQACLPGQDHVILYYRAASDSYLRHDQTAASNANVMGHLHQVVYLGARPNHCVVDPTAVDRGVGPNLYVVADQTSGDVGNSFVPRITSRVPKPRRTDPGTGVQHHSISQRRTSLHHGMGVNPAFVADSDTSADHDIRPEHAVRPQPNVSTDGCTARHGNAPPPPHSRPHPSGVMNAPHGRFRRGQGG